MSNIQTVQTIYEAFGRGDVPAIMSKLSDSVEWDYSANSTEVPWLFNRKGKDETAGFFVSLSELEFNKFEPKEFLEGDNIVVVLLDIGFTVKPTGKQIGEKDAVHIWRFNKEGKVERFRHGIDTHKHHLAYKS